MGFLKAVIVPVTQYQQNCSVVWEEATGRGAVVDPGGDIDDILAAAEENDVKIEKILLTHGHLDHCSAAPILREKLNVPIEGPHEADRFWIDNLKHQCEQTGFPPADSFESDRWLEDGDTVTVGDEVLNVRHCPGHTPGHVVFHHPESKFAWVGDVLFKGSIGRTDFPKGNHEELLSSIRERLWPMGEETVFVPGHGPLSTFGDERRENPFVADEAAE